MQEFKQSVGAHLDYDFQVKVLTTGHWPNENRDPTVHKQGAQQENLNALPRSIRDSMSLFKQYYLNKFFGRTLFWKLN